MGSRKDGSDDAAVDAVGGAVAVVVVDRRLGQDTTSAHREQERYFREQKVKGNQDGCREWVGSCVTGVGAVVAPVSCDGW